MNKTTTVMNVITEEKHTYYNSLSLKENLISAIISSIEDGRKLIDHNYRKKIGIKAKIEMIASKNGTKKAYSPNYDMIAYKS